MARLSLLAVVVTLLFVSVASANVVELTDSNFGDLVGIERLNLSLFRLYGGFGRRKRWTDDDNCRCNRFEATGCLGLSNCGFGGVWRPALRRPC